MEDNNKLNPKGGLALWKQRYYPVAATSPQLKSTLERLYHALTKWLGFREDALTAHGLRLIGNSLVDDTTKETFRINYESCSLCTHYMETAAPLCSVCPLFQQRGRRCDQSASFAVDSPWTSFSHGNPEPMIQLLQKAIAQEISKAPSGVVPEVPVKPKAVDEKPLKWQRITNVGHLRVQEKVLYRDVRTSELQEGWVLSTTDGEEPLVDIKQVAGAHTFSFNQLVVLQQR